MQAELEQNRAMKIPRLLANIRHSHTFRFQTTALLGEYNVLGSDLCQLQAILLAKTGGVGTTSSWAAAFVQAQLNYVEMWAPAGGGVQTEVLLNWFPAAGLLGKDVSDSTVNPMVPAHLRTRPPRLYPAQFPQGAASATQLFAVSCPSDTVIDVNVSFVWSDGHTTATIVEPYTGSLATVGTINAGPLDAAVSIANATAPRIVPIGLHPVFA